VDLNVAELDVGHGPDDLLVEPVEDADRTDTHRRAQRDAGARDQRAAPVSREVSPGDPENQS
jgi:hypothetical protein